MNKILYLSLILFVVVLLSSFIKYEHFTASFKLKFEKCEIPDDYPQDDLHRFSIQYKNETCNPIKVWLDDQPFCLPIDESGYPIGNKIDEGKCLQGDPENPVNWTQIMKYLKAFKNTNNDKISIKPLPVFSVFTKNSGEWHETPSDTPSRYQILLPGQVWRIQPPAIEKEVTDNNGKKEKRYEPYMCFDQHCTPGTDIVSDRVYNEGLKKEPWKGKCVPYCDSTYCTTDMKNRNKPCNSNGTISPTETKCYKRPLTDQSTDQGIRRNCPGTGAWITGEKDNMSSVDGVTKVEYNNNGHALWFDVSAVDGLNTNISTDYTGKDPSGNPSCPTEYFTQERFKDSEGESKTECTLGIDNPKQIAEENKIYYDMKKGVPTFPSLKDWPHDYKGDYYRTKTLTFNESIFDPISVNMTDKCNENEAVLDNVNFQTAVKKYITTKDGNDIDKIYAEAAIEFNKGPYESITDKPVPHALAGCQPGDKASKTLCHLWWSFPKNECANSWLNFIQGKDNCQQYAWAYDEMRFGMNAAGIQEFWNTDGSIADGMLDNYNFNVDGNPTRDNKNATNKTKPLLRCNINNGSFNISIKKLMKGEAPYSDEKTALCTKLKKNWRYITKSDGDDTCTSITNQGSCEAQVSHTDKKHAPANCLWQGDSCHTPGTQCGVINKEGKQLNCYQYDGNSITGQCSAVVEKDCNSDNEAAPKLWCPSDTLYSNTINNKIQTEYNDRIKNNPDYTDIKCFTPNVLITADNIDKDDIVGYTTPSNWGGDKLEDCGYPKYFVP
jgi:hypothetical protein